MGSLTDDQIRHSPDVSENKLSVTRGEGDPGTDFGISAKNGVNHLQLKS